MADLLIVNVSDLETFLGADAGTLDQGRGQMMVDLALDACLGVVSPLTRPARGTVLTVAARAYSNPTGVTHETVGPYSVTRPAAGIYLTRAERASLRNLAGFSGAFSIDPTPDDAGTLLPSQDQNITWISGIPLIDQSTSG
jgi:hypothetical protein